LESENGNPNRTSYYVGWPVAIVISLALGMMATTSFAAAIRYALHILAFAGFWAGAIAVVVALVNRSRPKWRFFQYWFFVLWVVFAVFAIIDIVW
jgi:hypothetical protein